MKVVLAALALLVCGGCGGCGVSPDKTYDLTPVSEENILFISHSVLGGLRVRYAILEDGGEVRFRDVYINRVTMIEDGLNIAEECYMFRVTSRGDNIYAVVLHVPEGTVKRAMNAQDKE